VTTGLVSAVARIARHEAAGRATAAVGVVTDAFPAAPGSPPDHAVTVQLRDTGLLLPRVPVAVGVAGFAAIPTVGELVLVVFLEGDRNAPVVAGRLYHPDLEPPEHDTGELVLRLPASEPKVELVVAAQTPTVTLDLPGGVHVEIGEGKIHLDVGGLHAGLDEAGGGRIEVAAGGSSITLKQDGDIAITAVGNLAIDANDVTIRGRTAVTVQGAVVRLN